MKKIVIAAIIIVVGLGAWKFFSRTSTSPEAATTPGETSSDVETPKSPLTGSQTYAINSEKTVMRWEGKKPLIPNYTDRGTIAVKSGTVAMKDGAVTSGSFIIDMTSIAAVSTGKNSGETMLSKHLKSAAFFDTEKFPTAEFVITGVANNPEDMMYQVAGNLTIKGITKPITFPAKIYQAGDAIKAEARVTLDRTNWNVRYGSDKFFDNLGDKIIDNIFVVEFTLVAEPAKS